MKAKFMIVVGLMAASAPCRVLAQVPAPPLGNASLEDLMSLEVTSVSKKEQALAKTGAAVFVISKEDIRRSGATNIPDLLRMAPGVDVAQIDSNQWAISIRGFNTLYSNKVLVLIDGRTVYTDTFSGVFWDQATVPLENIERIEIIRGPGGTVWGANAVNGVINIITKSSADTKRALVTGVGGSGQTAEAMAQYGGDAGSNGAYRVFGRYFNTAATNFPGGLEANDGWHTWQAGFRSDWSPSSHETFSVQGDFLASEGGATSSFVFTAPLAEHNVNNSVTNNSGDVLARWVHTLANGSEASLQIYGTIMRRESAGIDLADDTLDVDFEHHVTVGSRQDLVWGLDYRVSRNSLTPTESYALRTNPAVRLDNLYTTFAQDEIRIARSLFLTLGSKFEHNAYTGFEFEPSTQLVWTASDRASLWASAGRAVRQPDHLEYGVQFNEAVVDVPGVGAALVTLNGNPHILAEHLNDYEAGYRGKLNSQLSLDITGFLSFYNRLETYEPQTPVFTFVGGAPLLVLPLTFANLGHAHDYGVEVFADWKVNRFWELRPGYSLLRMTTGVAPTSADTFLGEAPGSSPRHQPEIRSFINLRRNIELDSSVKYVSALPALNVPGYLGVDLRLGWRLGESMELSLAARNLSSGRHVEFVDLSGLFLTTDVTQPLRKDYLAILVPPIGIRLRLGLILGTMFLARAVAQKFDEYQVKAAFVVNFASFVEWPATAFQGPEDPFTICVLGRDPFGHWLESLVAGKAVDKRVLAVRHVNDAPQVTGCQILFLSASERLRFRSILRDLKGSSVLSVGDTADFIGAGGVIALRMDGSKIRIQIYAQGAKERSLRISAHLLSLAEDSR